MGYRSCFGLIRLATQYSPARLEAAAERGLLTGAIGLTGAILDIVIRRASNSSSAG